MDKEVYKIKEEAKQFFDAEHHNKVLTLIEWGKEGIGINYNALERVVEEPRFKVRFGLIEDGVQESVFPLRNCMAEHSMAFVVFKQDTEGFGYEGLAEQLATIMQEALNEANENGEI